MNPDFAHNCIHYDIKKYRCTFVHFKKFLLHIMKTFGIIVKTKQVGFTTFVRCAQKPAHKLEIMTEEGDWSHENGLALQL